MPTTIKDGTWYLHVLPEFTGTVEARGAGKPRAVALLRSGEPIEHSFCDGTLKIDRPPAVRTGLDDVAVVRW